MVSEGRTWQHTLSIHGAWIRTLKKNMRSLSWLSLPCCLCYFLVQITVIQWVLLHHSELCRDTGCSGSPGWCLCLLTTLTCRIYFGTCGSSRPLFLLIMQIKCSLMDDNISLVTGSCLHNRWSIRRTERQIYNRGRDSLHLERVANILNAAVFKNCFTSHSISCMWMNMLHVCHGDWDELQNLYIHVIRVLSDQVVRLLVCIANWRGIDVNLSWVNHKAVWLHLQ